ncbi:hypothetical protein ACWCXX_40895 [Streptomyces sp. NPDC001732]
MAALNESVAKVKASRGDDGADVHEASKKRTGKYTTAKKTAAKKTTPNRVEALPV